MSPVRSLGLLMIFGAAVFTTPRAGAESDGAGTGCRLGLGACAYIACRLAEQLGPTATAADVSVVEFKSDRQLPSTDAVRERVQAAVANALRPAGGEARIGTRSKLRVELRIENNAGMLLVNADLRRATSLWQRVRHERPRAEQHGFVEAPLDAELRALIPPPPLVVSEVVKLKAPERGLVALSCGPLARSGGQELALVSRSSVRVGHIAGHAFVERTRVAWSTLSAVAPAPLREPIASAEITPQGTLRVGLTDRQDGLELSADLSIIQRFVALFPTPGGGCAARSSLGLLSNLEPCTGPGGGYRNQVATFDAVAGSALTQLGRELDRSSLAGARPELSQATLRVGAQLAVGDADSDGNPELAYSANTLDAASDRLTLVTLQENKLAPRFELSAPGISAIAICSRRDGPGMAPIVVGTGDELWVIR